MTPPIWLLCAASFSVGAGMRLLDPLLPMLAGEFGTGLGAVAALVGGFSLAYGLGQLALTPLGDRFGKLRISCATLAVYALIQLACALPEALGTLLALRIAAGLLAAAVIPLIMAHIGDTVPYERRQAVLGQFLTGMVMAQLLVGPLSGVIADHLGWRASFLVFGGFAVLVVLAFAQRLGAGLWRAEPSGSRGGLGGLAKMLRNPKGRRLMAAAFCDGMLLFGGTFPFVASYLIQDFHLSAGEAGVIAAGFGLSSLVYTRSAPWLLRRLGERNMVVVGGFGLAAGLALIALAPAWWVAGLVNASLGFLFFLLHGVLQARATEALPEARATAMAGFSMSIFFGQATGSVLFGTIIVWVGFPPAFLLAAAGVALLGLAIRIRVLPRP
jgi:predicted MFS family arabinose efflux permease